MITTITLNPSIDRMLFINGFQLNSINRVSLVKTCAGGKGINVSRVLKLLGSDTLVSGIVAGSNGKYIEKVLEEENLKTDFIYINGESRINTKIYDLKKSTTTDVNEPGPIISQTDSLNIIEKAGKLSYKSTTMVLSGSIPPGMKPDIYRALVENAISQGCSVILDCDGANLQEGIKGAPTLIKPNICELEALFGKKLPGVRDLQYAAAQLISEGVKYIAVSMGENGVCLFSKNSTFAAEAVKVNVKGTVGAGDTMVAVFAHALDKCRLLHGADSQMQFDTLVQALPLAVSASAVCVEKGGTRELDSELLGKYMSSVNVKEVLSTSI